MSEQSVYVVLLNWNGWRDSIGCLQSLLGTSHANTRLVLCDNASSDGSLEQIERWARGELDPAPTGNARLDRLLHGQHTRPRYQRLTREQAERGAADPQAKLLLIDNGANLGFAAGNNVGLRFALAQANMSHVWLLNNDTLVEPDCLARMLARLNASAVPAVCGSIIHFMDQPQIIQAIGGNRFNTLTGCASQSEGRYLEEKTRYDVAAIAGKIDYLSGCSMLLPRDFLQRVGLMCEDYFLYYEEIDWFTRAAGRFAMHIADGALLYHREGSSIGTSGWQRRASPSADYYLYRSRLLFMRKYHPQALPLCYLACAVDALKRILRGQWRNALAVARSPIAGALPGR